MGNGGFVLPTTLLVMTLLTIMLTAAFTMVSAEYRQTDNSLGRARAHALAQAAMQTYYSENRPLTGTSDSMRIWLTGGFVDVVATRLRDSTAANLAVWLVRANATSLDPQLSGQVTGKRTIVQLAHYNAADFPAQAAFYAANGLHLIGTASSNPITGNDAAGCPVTNVPGLVTRNNTTQGYSEAVNNADPAGSPGMPSTYGSQAAVVAATRVNWASLVAGNFTPDYQLPGPVSWADSSVILNVGNYTLPATGLPSTQLGILVVTGNLTMQANTHWHGVILVGGRLIAPPGARVHGMVITGLNIALGQTVAKDTISRDAGAGPTEFQWRSCEYKAAIRSLAGLMPIGNAWVDTWSTY